MRTFDPTQQALKLLTPQIVRLITEIHEYKGKQELYIEAHPDILGALLSVARVQSTGASNRIEGISTSDARLNELVNEKAEPKNRSEQEISGYRDVLRTIHESYDYIVPRPNILLQLHRDLYAYSASTGGHWKNADNVIEEIDADGSHRVRFKPVPAFETPQAMEDLCSGFVAAINKGTSDPLLLVPVFILDFLCIHPFNDGNGRMSRLLTLLLLYREGYIVGKYISLEMIVEKSKETYYDTLQNSSMDWHAGTNDYTPFVAYFLGVLLNAYKDFSSRVEHLVNRKLTKAERIRRIFANRVGKISKGEIAAQCPDISITTIEKVLGDLLKENAIVKIGSGRSTAYIRNP